MEKKIMWRKSILAKRSPVTTEVKSVVLNKQTIRLVKGISFGFIFCMLFAACPANAQRKAAKQNNTAQQSNEYKLEIKRSFHVSEQPEDSPRHGDYTILKELENGGTVGSLHLFKPREAIFLIWDGEVIAGPLITVKQVEEAYEMLSRMSASEHETRMEIMKNFPTGRNKRVRVYDKSGNLIREEP